MSVNGQDLIVGVFECCLIHYQNKQKLRF